MGSEMFHEVLCKLLAKTNIPSTRVYQIKSMLSVFCIQYFVVCSLEISKTLQEASVEFLYCDIRHPSDRDDIININLKIFFLLCVAYL